MTVAHNQGGLGRGLSALIPPHGTTLAAPVEIPLSRIEGNPFQPRQRLDDAELERLAASIRDHGVLAPILVSETLDGYRLVAGERRVRAARLAGLERIPAVVRQVAERDLLELALVENLQREDLDPIEEAHAYRQLIDEFGFTQERLAERVSRARSSVANTLRLLDLPEAIQRMIIDGRITAGHARAIAGLEGPVQLGLATTIAERALSVRQAEELARRLGRVDAPVGATAGAGGRGIDPDLERLEEDLRRTLGTKVNLTRSRRGGRIIIEFYDDAELGRLVELLTGADA
ncbi:MAG TPA: ParB/RepB/Spo0J family partition protein [Candidatus Limnocylindrales bacterium]|nr:ParB/RepB/Spo0J family partition protein [Candidatus Limnocylindrales bacterium]